MASVRSRGVQIVLGVVLVPLLGVAGYQVAVRVWAHNQYRAATQALERYDYWQASKHLESYLSARPNDPEGLLLAGQTARRRGDFQATLRLLRQAEQHGASAEALSTERQLLRIQMGDLTDADRLSELCTEHANEPAGALALEVFIEGSLRAVNVSRARWAVDLWLTKRTGAADQAQGLVWRGRVNELVQDFPQALADFRAAVERDPDHPPARLWLAQALIREEPREAAPHLEWLRRRADDPEVRLLTARFRRTLGEQEEAARLLDELLAAAPDNVPALVERGRVALDLNRPDEAERWLTRALALAPDMRDVNLALADCMRQAGRADEAKRYQIRVQEIDERLKKQMEQLTRSGQAVGK
jgi:tetratricopeptide (TPR) repeat protein